MPELPIVPDFKDPDTAIKKLIDLLDKAYQKFLKDLKPAQKQLLILALIRVLRILNRLTASVPGGCVTEDGQVLTAEECRLIPCP